MHQAWCRAGAGGSNAGIAQAQLWRIATKRSAGLCRRSQSRGRGRGAGGRVSGHGAKSTVRHSHAHRRGDAQAWRSGLGPMPPVLDHFRSSKGSSQFPVLLDSLPAPKSPWGVHPQNLQLLELREKVKESKRL